MTETIYAQFEAPANADAAIDELKSHGIEDTGIIYDEIGSVVTVRVDINDAIEVRTIIERHGGLTDVNDIPDVGTIPADPLQFSEEDEAGKDWAGR